MKRRSTRVLVSTGLAVTMTALIVTPTSATSATSAASTQAPSTGFARAGHFAPGKGPVDLVVDGKVAARGLTYKKVTPYLAVPAGPHSFALRTAEGQTVLRVRAGIPANGAVTIGAVTTRGGLAGNVYDDRLQTPKSGTALVRFVHTAPVAKKLDIAVVGGPTLARNVSYPSATPYRSVGAGSYDIEVRATGTEDVLLRITGWKAAAGSQSSIVLVNTEAGKLDAVPFMDSAATPTPPQGGTATGLGGTAVDRSQDGWSTARSLTMLVAVMIAAATVAGLTHRRRRVG